MAEVQVDRSLYGDLISGDELSAYWMRERAIHEAMLQEIGEL